MNVSRHSREFPDEDFFLFSDLTWNLISLRSDNGILREGRFSFPARSFYSKVIADGAEETSVPYFGGESGSSRVLHRKSLIGRHAWTLAD